MSWVCMICLREEIEEEEKSWTKTIEVQAPITKSNKTKDVMIH